MDIKKHTHPEALLSYSFWWSEARLVIASIALFIGGVPPVWYLAISVPALFGIVRSGLILAWIISGLAAAYLFYRWTKANMTLFGGKKPADTAAFLICTISGLNLGIAGLIGRNIGMAIFPSYAFFVIMGLAYLATAYYLFNRFKAFGKKLF